MPDRDHSNADQVVGGQLCQYSAIDIVVAERGKIAPETQTLEPRRDVHQAPPSSLSKAFASLRSGVSKPSVNQP